MLVIGLTGGIATGKSTVSSLLKSQGVPIIDADLLAREVVLPGTHGHAQVVAHFGPSILLPDGSIDRPKLGSVVFADEAERRKLNSIVHPMVRRAMFYSVIRCWIRGERLCVLDVPLLIEGGLWQWVGKVLVVYCPESIQLQRLMARDKSTQKAATSRVLAQLPIDDKVKYADEIIENSGSIEDLENQVQRLVAKLNAELSTSPMSTDNQVALSRFHRTDGGSFNRTARQIVPPFLQKLYGMVSDPATDDLIRWSDAGDSFVVLDHERVAHDVLPRWFKHNNFNSFVRQLNMYGFHKVPHLQQGVLRSDAETEVWNFENPNFHRGQPDLLCLISRKKQASERITEDSQAELRDPLSSTSPTAAAGSILDVNQIVNGISAIKRHQAAISADLNDLKASNEHLWQEAIAARDRHTKHQDTINRILKFLAGVFGQSSSPRSTANKGPPQPVFHRTRQPLLIEGTQNDKVSTPAVTTIPDSVNLGSPEFEHPDDDDMSNRFSTIEPSSALPSPLSSRAAITTPLHEPVEEPASNILSDNFVPIPSSSSYFPASSYNYVTQDSPQGNQSLNPSPMNMLASSSPNSSSPDAMLQAILNSPGQRQRLQSLLSWYQHGMALPILQADGTADSNQTSAAQFQPYFPNEYSRGGPMPSNPGLAPSVDVNPQTMALTSQIFDSNSNFEPLLDNVTQLQKSYKDTDTIVADVDALQADIDSLLLNLGLDPDAMRNLQAEGQQHELPPHEDPVLSQGSHAPNIGSATEGDKGDLVTDFDFDSLLNQFSSQNGDLAINLDDLSDQMPDPIVLGNTGFAPASPASSNVVFDEGTPQSDASSPRVTRSSAVDTGHVGISTPLQRSHKRKSDLLDVPYDTRTSIDSNTKRKR